VARNGTCNVLAGGNLFKTMRHRNLLYFLVLSAVWGSAFTAIKAGLEYFPPVLFAALRFDIAGLFLVAYAAYTSDRLRPTGRAEWLDVAASGVLIIAGYHALLFVGEQYTTSAAAAVVVGLNPVATTAFARVFLPDERLSAAGIAGLLLGLGGVVALVGVDPAALASGRGVGVALVFGATVAFSLGSVLSRRSGSTLPSEASTAWSMLVGAVVLHAGSLAYGEGVGGVALSIEAVGALAYLAVVASGLGFLIYFDLLERLGPVEINLVSYAAPVVAAATGLLLLGEVPTVQTGVGFLAICGGFALVKRRALAAGVGRLRRGGVGDDA
jgi:drug/metabolite transporter (DMT)-like permease